MEHKHQVNDLDNHFIIDGITRLVKNETETKSMLVQYDHNSERFTFKVPRHVEEHDLTLCNSVRVHYINIDKNRRLDSKGVYTVEDLAVCPEDDDYVICSWLISNNATKFAGSLHFVVQFACIEEDKVLYSWNTAKYTGVTIQDGLDSGEAIVEEYNDVLTEWKNQLESSQLKTLEQTTFSTVDNGENVWTATFGDGRTQELKVRNGSTGLVGSIRTISDSPLHFFVGSQEEYDALSDKQKQNLFAIIADEDYHEIKTDENGVLKIGDNVIPQRKALIDSAVTIDSNAKVIYEDSNSLNGRVFEILARNRFFKFRVNIKDVNGYKLNFAGSFVIDISPFGSDTTKYEFASIHFVVNHETPTQLKAYYRYTSDGTVSIDESTTEIEAVYEIIE